MLLAFLTTFLVGMSLQPLVIRWLRHRGVVDTPNHRSSHVAQTPRGAGIGVVVSMCAGFRVAGGTFSGPLAALLIVLLCMAALGLLEDVIGVPALIRLSVQMGVGALGIVALGGPGWTFALVPVWVAAYTNAFNFMDGANGISGFNALFVGLVYAITSARLGLHVQMMSALVLAAGAVGFLPWNVPHARVFLGDVGSYALGGFISLLATSLALSGVPLVIVLAPLSVYLTDTGITMIRRARSRESLLEAHRSHAYQRAVACGASHIEVSLATVAVAGAVTLAAWLSTTDRSPLGVSVSVGAALSALGSYLALPSIVGRLRQEAQG